MTRDKMITQQFSYAQNFAHSFARKTGLDPDEAESAAMLALVQAADQYDPSKSSFKTYASHKIYGYLRHALTAQTKQRHNIRELKPESSVYDPNAVTDDLIDMEKLLASSTSDEAAIDALIMHALGARVREIADAQKVSPSTVRKQISGARKDLLERI